MPRGLVTLFAFLEALFVIGMGLIVPLVTAVVAWTSIGGSSATPAAMWRLAVDGWALGHGVPLSVTLGDASRFLVGDNASFVLSVAPLGVALLSVVLGRRMGRRVASSDDATLVVGLTIFFVAALTALLLSGASGSGVTLDVPTGTARIVAVISAGIIAGWKPWESVSRSGGGLVPAPWRDLLRDAARASGAATLILVAVSALLVAVVVANGFGAEIELYESLHAGVGGGFVLTVVQIASAPLVVVWVIAWLAGPGFALGTGSLVSPFTSTVGAVPAVPLLGAIPTHVTPGWWVALVPVIAGAIGSALMSTPRGSLGRIAAGGLASGAIVSLGALVVGAFASGSAGPGRFEIVGIDPVLTALALGIEVAAGALVVQFVRVLAGGPR